MLRDFLKNTFRLFPKSFQESYRKRQYEKWAATGRSTPPPQVVKLFALRALQKKYSLSTFIETGTYKGDMIYMLKDDFPRLVSVELSPLYYDKAVVKFKKDTHVDLVFGDSGVVMPQIIKKLSSSALFWLDGHFSSGETAQGELDCPIFGELDSIFKSKHPHVLLIDDARCFNGTNDYPTIPTLEKYILEKKPGSVFTVKDDLITIIPKELT